DRSARRRTGHSAGRIDRHRHAARPAARGALAGPTDGDGFRWAALVPPPLRALVVGLGSIGRRHARNWAALGLGPVAVCRQTNTRQPEPLGIDAREFSKLETALDDRPDVVLVTNPTSQHVETASTALRAGAHVFVEKPIGHALDGIAGLLSEA